MIFIKKNTALQIIHCNNNKKKICKGIKSFVANIFYLLVLHKIHFVKIVEVKTL